MDRVRAIDQQVSHIWMVRTFLKHADEAEDDEDLRDIVRDLYDFILAVGPVDEVDDPAVYLKMAKKKLRRLTRATELYEEIQPEVSMRELSLGLVRPSEMMRVWWKEVSVGMINGAVLGGLVAILAVLFDGNYYLGLVVGLALLINTIVAVSIGGVVPLLMKRFGFDPAVASGPLLTTVTDMCGFFLVLGLATMLLSKLV